MHFDLIFDTVLLLLSDWLCLVKFEFMLFNIDKLFPHKNGVYFFFLFQINERQLRMCSFSFPIGRINVEMYFLFSNSFNLL